MLVKATSLTSFTISPVSSGTSTFIINITTNTLNDDGYQNGLDVNPLIEDPPEGNIPLLPYWAMGVLVTFLLLVARKKIKAPD